MSNEQKKPRTRKSSSRPAARQTSAARLKSLELQNARLQQELAERKQAEEALQESEKRYRQIVDTANEGIWVLDEDRRTTFVNARLAQMLGYQVEEMIGRRLEIFVFDEDLPDHARRMESRRQGLAEQYERRFRHKEGEDVWTIVSATPLFDASHHFRGSFGMLTDITERKQAEEAITNTHLLLEQALRFTEALLSAIPTPVFYKDKEGRYLGCNRAFSKFMGVTSDQIKGKTVYELWPSEHAEVYHSKDLELMRNPARQIYEFKVRDKDGLEHPVIYSKDVFRDETDQVAGIVGAFMDITEGKQAEEALRRLNRELRAISDCNQTLLRAVDEQTLLDDICRIVCDEAGYRMAWVGYAESDEARTVRPVAWAGVEAGYLAHAHITWTDTERGRGPTGTAIRSGESVCIQDFTADPQTAPWRENAVQRGYRSNIALPLKDDSANTFGALTIYSTAPNAFTSDEMRLLEELAGDLAFGITTLRTRAKHKRAEEALWESSQMLQLVLNNMPAYVFWKDRNSVYLGCNHLFAANAGLSSPQEIVGLTDFDLPWKDAEAESYRAGDRLVMETGLPKINYEETQLIADGRVAAVRTSKVPLRNPAGDVIGVLGTFEDISERKRAEEALRESQALYRSFIEQLPNPVFRKDNEGRYVMVNSKFCQLKGVKAEDFLGRKPTEVANSELTEQGESGQAVKYAAQGEEIHELIMRTGQVVEMEEEHLSADGGRQCMHVIRMPVFDSEGKVVGTQGIQFDVTERKRAEEEIYTLNQELEQRVIDRTAELARAHEHLRAILDTAGEGVVFTDPQGTIEYINPAMERLTGYLAAEVSGRNPRVWKSGQTPAAVHQQMWSALTRGEIWQGELVNRRKDGRLYDAALNAAPLTNPDGQIVGFVGVQRDITRQKELDRMKDQFVSNVSHELRTPLANVLLHIRLLEQGKPDKRDVYLQTLRHEAERLRQMIEDLLDLSRLDRNVVPIQLAPIDLNQLLDHLVTDRAALAEQHGLTFTYEPTPNLPPVLTDASQLIQVASNLLTNALNYTPAGGAVSVGAEVRRQGGQKMVAFTVRDTGPGIAAQDMPHLFERFYRGAAGRQTSAPGTGLGLAISQEIMERLGGRITVESEADHGAAFTVWLPTA